MSRKEADGGKGGKNAKDNARTPAEWVTFAVSLAVLSVLVAFIAVQIPKSKSPPAPRAMVGAIVQREGLYVVPVTIENEGDATAEAVQVLATLEIGDDEHTADQVVDFLAGGETEKLEFVFEDDPDDGELDVTVGGYLIP